MHVVTTTNSFFETTDESCSLHCNLPSCQYHWGHHLLWTLQRWGHPSAQNPSYCLRLGAAPNFSASHASPCLSISHKARHSRPLEWTSLSHVSPMASYMWLPLGHAAYPNLAYSYPTIRRAMWSAQKPCRTEERLSCFLIFYISLTMEGHLIYINCPMYPPGKGGYLHYLLLMNHPNKLFIQNLVVYWYFIVLGIPGQSQVPPLVYIYWNYEDKLFLTWENPWLHMGGILNNHWNANTAANTVWYKNEVCSQGYISLCQQWNL